MTKILRMLTKILLIPQFSTNCLAPNEMPSIEEMRNVYDIPEEEGPARERALRILKWYATYWLMACSTIQWFGTTVKPFCKLGH